MTGGESNGEWLHRRLTPEQARCLDTLLALGRIYNLEKRLVAYKQPAFRFPTNTSMEVYLRGPLSTYDSAGLTDLVLAAHNNCVRVEISPRSHASVQIYLTARDPDGVRLFERHPTIYEVLRSNNGKACE